MPEDRYKQELVQKVKSLIYSRFGGDFESAFKFYSRRRKFDSQIGEREITDLLSDAGVGNTITRGAWARGVMNLFDKNRDGFISWAELKSEIMHDPLWRR